MSNEKIFALRKLREYYKDEPKLVKVVCPKCNGDYWKDPLRKCSNCTFGYIMVPENRRQK